VRDISAAVRWQAGIIGSKKALLFEKRSKNFYQLWRAVEPTRAPISKSFCFFFQKEVLSFVHFNSFKAGASPDS
jgi:hypothetical protein